MEWSSILIKWWGVWILLSDFYISELLVWSEIGSMIENKTEAEFGINTNLVYHWVVNYDYHIEIIGSFFYVASQLLPLNR